MKFKKTVINEVGELQDLIPGGFAYEYRSTEGEGYVLLHSNVHVELGKKMEVGEEFCTARWHNEVLANKDRHVTVDFAKSICRDHYRDLADEVLTAKLIEMRNISIKNARDFIEIEEQHLENLDQMDDIDEDSYALSRDILEDVKQELAELLEERANDPNDNTVDT